tara:strand:- start:2315 stop:2977 length:663 start_codon:yes stop_codon:yes gene_type:complete
MGENIMKITRRQLRKIIYEVLVRGDINVDAVNGDLQFSTPDGRWDSDKIYSLIATETGIPLVDEADVSVTKLEYTGEEGSDTMNISAVARADIIPFPKNVSDSIESDTISMVLDQVGKGEPFTFSGDYGTITGTQIIAEAKMKITRRHLRRLIAEETRRLNEQGAGTCFSMIELTMHPSEFANLEPAQDDPCYIEWKDHYISMGGEVNDPEDESTIADVK